MAKVLRYPASRYQPNPPPDLGARSERERLSSPALKAFFNIMARWKVRDEDARALLGGVSNGPFYEMKRNPDRLLDTDRLTRISALVGIFKALHILHSRRLADEWVRLSNTNQIFAGETPLAYMMRGGLPAILTVRRLRRRSPRRVMGLPPLELVRQFDTHRLVPSRHLPGTDSVLVAIADDDAHLQAIFDLDAATNDRLLAGQRLMPGIGVEELVFGLPNAAIVNAAFCHPNPLGGRFNTPERGAWYSAFELETSQAEVGFHKSVQLAEIGRFDDSVTYDDYLADFSAEFHDLRGARGFGAALSPDTYVESQALTEDLMKAESLGVVYPSVRHRGGTCLACFRPALVGNVRRTKTYRFTWNGSPDPVITVERPRRATLRR